MLVRPHAHLQHILGTAPIEADYRAGDPLPLDLPSPARSLAYALTCGVIVAVLSYAFLAYFNRPLPTPTGAGRPHLPAAYTTPLQSPHKPVRVVYR